MGRSLPGTKSEASSTHQDHPQRQPPHRDSQGDIKKVMIWTSFRYFPPSQKQKILKLNDIRHHKMRILLIIRYLESFQSIT